MAAEIYFSSRFSYVLFYCDCLYLAEHSLRKIFYCHAASCRFGCEVFCIYFVECSKICNLSQETGRLYNFIITTSCCFQNSSYIFAALLSLCCNSFCNITCCRIHRNLIQRCRLLRLLHSLRIRSDCAWCFFCCDNVHWKIPPSVLWM